MYQIGEIKLNDDLTMWAPPNSRLTPAQALDLAEHITRQAFRNMLAEEVEKHEQEQPQ